MTVAWPAIPGPSASSYQLSVSPRIATVGMDRGPGRTRLIGRGTTTTLSLTFTWNDAQFATFRAWWQTTAACGTQSTTIPLRNGHSSVTGTVAWLGTYQASDLGGVWRVSIPAEWIDPPRADAATLTDILAATASDPNAFDSFDLFHATVHTTMPWALLP